MTTDISKLHLNVGTDDHLSGYGYRRTIGGQILKVILTVFSIGSSFLIFYWKPAWKVKLLYKRAKIEDADIFLLKDRYDQYFIVDVQKRNVDDVLNTKFFSQGSSSSSDSDERTALLNNTQKVFQYIDHHEIRYYWSDVLHTYVRLHGLEIGYKCQEFHQVLNGFSQENRYSRQIVFGKNSIDIEVKSYVQLFFEEVVNPFYIFQVASITLWMSDNYYYYASTIIIISLISIAVSLYETKKQSITLHNMVKTPETPITVFDEENKKVTVSHYELVPGDVVEIPSHGCTLLFDAVLMTGNCIVNEAMLTGESVPVTKTPLPHTSDTEAFNIDEHKRHVLFCGTHILQTKSFDSSSIKAVVIRTGFETAKGELIRSIMFPKPMDFKFYKDAIRFILFLGCLSLCGMAYSVYTLTSKKHETGLIVRKVLDIVTIIVPPALPAAMTVGMVYAQGRLKNQGIFCISPPRINICGKLKLMCFDKTGTLTEDGLDLWGMVPLVNNSLNMVYQDAKNLAIGPFLSAMATCHSLTHIDGKLNGDPLDLKMFEATEWVLEEYSAHNSKFDKNIQAIVRHPSDAQGTCEIGILKQFTFSSSLQRMSVVTRTFGSKDMDLYVKGAPEKIATLCLPTSIPDHFEEILRGYTMQGFRVIAFAHKPLTDVTVDEVQKATRDQFENDLLFSGLLVMQNALKPETTGIIRQLRMANVRTVMVTGDNILTAVSVARECSIIGRKDRVIQVQASPPAHGAPAQIEWIAHETRTRNASVISNTKRSLVNEHLKNLYTFVVDGKSFAVVLEYFPELMARICQRGAVFARMGPEQKAQLVEEYQKLGYTTGMCGDGANDCSALKTAHAGISLSEAEASVASPFTSRIPNISCVPTVIREGRAALVTSFGCFKYMALYSITQFASVLILYWVDSNLADIQFLYIDLVITTTVAFLMGHTHAYHKLVYQRPKGSLISFRNLFSITTQILITILVQILAFFYLFRQTEWFVPYKPLPKATEINTKTWEATVIFNVSCFQYVTLAINFSIGPPYRKRMWTNKPFFIACILLTILSLGLLFYPPSQVEQFLYMHHIPYEYYGFKIVLLMFVGVHFMASFITEMFIVESDTFHKVSRFIRCKRSPNNKYKLVSRDLEQNFSWPPVGEITYATHQRHIEITDSSG